MLRSITYLAPMVLLLAPIGTIPVCLGQEPAAGRALGVVTKMDAAARQISLQTTTGEVAVTVDAKAKVLRVAPGATTLSNAAAIELSDINVGDRLRARGRMTDDQKSLAALEIVVISQSDIASKQAAERADWDRRGATGIVADTGADSITINVRTIEGVKPLVITPAPNAVIRRYTPDSVKFADAKPSTLSEIRKGDQVRARGNKTPDGAQMTADEIVSGQFKMIAGLVLSVDPQENVVRINNIETKKPMTVKISTDSSLKKLQPPLAQAIANRLHGVPPGDRPPGATGAGAAGWPDQRRWRPGRGPRWRQRPWWIRRGTRRRPAIDDRSHPGDQDIRPRGRRRHHHFEYRRNGRGSSNRDHSSSRRRTDSD